MGLWNLIGKKNTQGTSKSIDISNGVFVDGSHRYEFQNCLIAGTKSTGRDALLRHLSIDSLNNDRAIFVIQNGTSLPNNTIRKEFISNCGSRQFFSIDFGQYGFTQPINLFKGSNPDFVQELLLLLMASYKEISSDTRSFVERYLSEVMSLYRIAPNGKKFSLSTICDFDEQWLVDESNRVFSNGLIDAKRRDRYLKYASNLVLYKKEYNEYENFCLEIQKQNFAKLLSGAISYSHLNTNQYITFINLDYISCAKQSSAFLGLFIHKAIQEMQINKNVKTTFIFEDVDLNTVPEFKELLKACQTTNGRNNVYFTLDAITNCTNLGYDPRAYSNAYFVFRQPIMGEAEEWAKTSGTYKKDKETQTTAPYKQVYGNQNQGFFGEMYTLFNGNKQVVTNVNHEIIDEYNILPVEFMNLPEGASKVIIKTPSGSPYFMEVKWA